MSKITAVGHVGIRVRDIRRSVDFYKKILGLKHVIEDHDFNAFEVGDTHFCIMSGKPQKEVAFDFMTEDVDALNRKLGKLGVHVSKVKTDRYSGHHTFYFEDPDGHRVYVQSAHPHPMREVD